MGQTTFIAMITAGAWAFSMMHLPLIPVMVSQLRRGFYAPVNPSSWHSCSAGCWGYWGNVSIKSRYSSNRANSISPSSLLEMCSLLTSYFWRMLSSSVTTVFEISLGTTIWRFPSCLGISCIFTLSCFSLRHGRLSILFEYWSRPHRQALISINRLCIV